MTKAEALDLLKKNKNEKGIAHWKKEGNASLKSYGIGLTVLRKLAKQIGRDHDLALKLWNSNVYDAKVIGLLIDEPKKVTREQAESQVEDVEMGMLAHVYSSCGATLAKTSFARELAVDWAGHKDDLRRRCGYQLLYELSKNTRDKKLDDSFFLKYLDRIEKKIHKEENWVRGAMNAALLGIGKRSLKLNKATIKAAKAIGPVEVDYGNNSCEPIDILKHLTTDRLQEKLKA